MAILPIRLVPDPVLRRKAKRVGIMDTSIDRLIDNMVETMRDAHGVGLAAPQVGISLRILVIEIPEEPVIALINPEVTRRLGERTVEEGCLSIPGWRGELTRSLTVRVKGLDRNGKGVRFKAEGLLAQALEHETDHLNGILYIDHVKGPDKLWKIEPHNHEEEEEGAPHTHEVVEAFRS